MGIATAGIPTENCTSTAAAAGSMIAALLSAREDCSASIPPIIVDALMESSRSGRPLGTVLEDYAKSEAEAVDAAIENLVTMSHSSDEKERQCANLMIAQMNAGIPQVKNFKMGRLKEVEEKYMAELYPYLKDYLNDSDTDVQIYAIELLGRASKWNSDAIGHLQQIRSSNTSEQVRDALDKAIHSLEGRKPNGTPDAGFYLSISTPAMLRFPHGINVFNSAATAGFTGSFGYKLFLKWTRDCDDSPDRSTNGDRNCDEHSQLRLSGNIAYERRGGDDYFFRGKNCYSIGCFNERSDSHEVGGYFDAEYFVGSDKEGYGGVGVGAIASLTLLGIGQFKQALLSLLNFSVGYKRAYMDGYAARYGDQEILQLGYKGLRGELEFGDGFGAKMAFFEPYYVYLLSHEKEVVAEEDIGEHESKHSWGLSFFSIELFFRAP